MKCPNIVVVICHDLGQYLGCYGHTDVRSPHLDAFAESSVRFENSFCTAPQCSPSRAALWTGRYPHATGVVGLTHAGFANDYTPDQQHLAQILNANGYETHLFGGQHEARKSERCGHHHIHGGGSCADVAQKFCDMLSQGDVSHKSEPLFAEICFSEPHRPFNHDDIECKPCEEIQPLPYIPDIPVVREDLALFEASISSADRAFGMIHDALCRAGIKENTLLIFTVDHGIPFPRAKMSLYDPGIETALIMSGPGLQQGHVYNECISNVDITPTLLDYVGIPVPEAVQGRSFHPLLIGEPYEKNTAIFAEKTYHTYYDPMRCIRTEKWKLIANFEFAPCQETSPDFDNNAHGYPETALAMEEGKASVQHYHPPFELYDLETDPLEQENLAEKAEYASVLKELAQQLREWMVETNDELLNGPIAQGAYRERMATFKSM